MIVATASVIVFVQRRELQSKLNELASMRVQLNLSESAREQAELKAEDNAASVERLRGQVEELARLRGEVANLRRQVARKNATQPPAPNARGTALNPNDAGDHEFRAAYETQRVQMENAATAIAAFVANHPDGKLSIDGKVNPEIASLAPALPWETIEMTFADVASMKRTMEIDPNTVVARSRTTIQDEKGGSVRWYSFADGSAAPRRHETDQETLVPLLLKK